MSLIFLDTETTDIADARLVQLAYRRIDLATREMIDECNLYFKPPTPIAFGAMAVHHITNEMVADKESFEGSATQSALRELVSAGIVVAHNAAFDLGVLEKEGVPVRRSIDTLRLSRHLLESEQYKLQYLRYSLGLGVQGSAHDAMGDVLVLEALFGHLADIVRHRYACLTYDEIIEKMFELSAIPVPLRALSFGKYSGKSFKEVARSDRGYLEWLYKSETQKPTADQNVDMVYTLQECLR